MAHWAIHAGYLSPRPTTSPAGAAWPFTIETSWLLGSPRMSVSATRHVGTAFTAMIAGGFALVGVAALAVLPSALWILGASIGAMASIALLVLFFHAWLVLGPLIYAVVLWAVLIARWEPGS